MSWQKRIDALEKLSGIEKLVAIMAMLRDPEHGCPWDLKQTFATIVPHTIEEAYEVAEAIDKEDYEELKAELGDLLFQVVFYGQLGVEEHRFDFESIAETMCDKLIRRHPHVFADQEFSSDAEIKANWEATKSIERNEKAKRSEMDDIPLALPALTRSYKIQKRAAAVGFDWPNIDGAIEKVIEEINEVKNELEAETRDLERIKDEIGDLYFALTNVTRHLGLKPEDVVHQANKKFERRFRKVEQLAQSSGSSVSALDLETLDALWERAKRQSGG